MQHGALDLRIAQLSDVELLVEARESALEFLDKGEDLLQYKQLSARVARLRTVTSLN
jgi:hypothetical protein